MSQKPKRKADTVNPTFIRRQIWVLRAKLMWAGFLDYMELVLELQPTSPRWNKVNEQITEKQNQLMELENPFYD